MRNKSSLSIRKIILKRVKIKSLLRSRYKTIFRRYLFWYIQKSFYSKVNSRKKVEIYILMNIKHFIDLYFNKMKKMKF